jgi:hypothetical protein
MMEAGDSYASKGQYEKAIKMYRQVKDKCGKNYLGVGDKIAKYGKRQREENDYKRCITIEACDYYLKIYPNGKYVSQVQKRKEEIKNDESIKIRNKDRRIIIEDSLYNICTSLAHCENYLRRYPDGRHVLEVRKKKDYFEGIRSEEDAYRACNTMSRCRTYMAKYPGGKYYEAVSAKMDSLEDAMSKTAYMNIDKVEFSNVNVRNAIIDDYGSILDASKIKYIKPQITYTGISDEIKEVTLYGRIINPNGDLIVLTDDEPGYSFNFGAKVKPGEGQIMEIDGYSGCNSPGIYTFELWYQGNRLCEATYTIVGEDLLSDVREVLMRCNENTTLSLSGGKYKGQMSQGLLHGLGMYSWDDGRYYVGRFYYRDFSGKGMLIITNPRKVVPGCRSCYFYVGNWSSDKKSGLGNCYDRSGNLIYQGDFKYDAPSGPYPSSIDNNFSYRFECKKYNDNSYYVGETKDGKRDGMGMMIYEGDLWYGEWSEGIAVGDGIYMYFKGNVKTGTWKGDDKQ